MQFHLYHALHKESYYPLNASCIHFFLFKYVHARSDTCCCITLGVLWQDKVFLRGPAVRGNTVKPTGSIVLEIITGSMSFLIATMCCRARRKVLVWIHLHPFLRHLIPYTKTDYPPFSSEDAASRQNIFVLRRQNGDGAEEDVAAKLNCQAFALNPNVPSLFIIFKTFEPDVNVPVPLWNGIICSSGSMRKRKTFLNIKARRL